MEISNFIPSERTSRQSDVVDQQKLSEATIGVTGSGYLADFLLFTLRGLDVGCINHYPGVEQGFQETLQQDDSLEEFATRMNFAQDYTCNPGTMNQLLVDTEARPRTDIKTETYLRPYERRIIQEPKENTPISALQAGVLAGLLGMSIVNYCQGNDLVLGRHAPLRTEQSFPASALVVGAGATGTYAALQAALAGFSRVDIMDGDDIAEHNRNRQVLYYFPRRQTKAETLSDRISLFGCESTAYPEMLTRDSALGEYDVVFSCVDKYEPRRILDAMNDSFVLVDGGTSVHSGRVHATRGSPRLSKLLDLSHADPVATEGCVQQVNPSIIMPNMIIGSFMVDEALAVLAGESPRAIRYDAHANEVYRE